MMSLIFGLIASGLGLWGSWVWRHALWQFTKGFVPISLFLAGDEALRRFKALLPTERHALAGDQGSGSEASDRAIRPTTEAGSLSLGDTSD